MNKFKWGLALLCIMTVFAMIGCENATTPTPAPPSNEELFKTALAYFKLKNGTDIYFVSADGAKVTIDTIEYSFDSVLSATRGLYTSKTDGYIGLDSIKAQIKTLFLPQQKKA